MSDYPPAPTLHPEYAAEELLDLAFEQFLELDRSRLEETSAALIGRALARFSVDRRRQVLRRVSTEKAADILAEMDEEAAAEVVSAMRESRAIQMLEGFDPDDAADVVSLLKEKDRTRLLGKLEPDTAEDINYLLTYDPETAGGIMTTEVATLEKGWTIDEAIQEVRRQREELEHIYYFYVVDENMRLQGVVSMRELLLAPKGSHIADIMDPRVAGVCGPEDDREDVALKMAELNFTALPVADKDNRLIGMVTHDDVLDILRDEATEDFQKMVGAGGDEDIHDPIGYSIRKRLPWLIVNMLTACLAAAVVYFYKDNIERISILAVIMPIIANIGGNTGAQTLAVLIRSLAVGEIHSRDTLVICLRESLKGLLNGLGIAVLAGMLIVGVTRQLMVGLVVFFAVILTMAFAGLSGAFIPLFLKKVNIDPAQSSSIFLTGVVDIVGFFIFLQLGSMLLL